MKVSGLKKAKTANDAYRMVLLLIALLVVQIGTASAQENSKPVPERFSKADTDNDGKLSLAEYIAAFKGDKAEKKFATADTDKDGSLSPAELKAARGQKPEKPVAKGFEKADANKDGKLSLEEFTAAFPGKKAEKRFSTADTDKDGSLSPVELKTARGKKPEKPEKPANKNGN